MKILLFKKCRNRLKDIYVGLPEFLISLYSFFRFMSSRVGEKAVLLVEPNAFHGEILPGYYKYFEDLGYDMFVLCRLFIVTESAFCRLPNKPNIFVMTPGLIRRVLRSKKLHKFDYLLVTSRQFFDARTRFWGAYINYLKFNPMPRLGCFYVEHNFDPHKMAYGTDLRNLFLLTRESYNGLDIPMLNPHWFGDVRHTPLNPGKRVFLFIGSASLYQKSIQMLLDIVWQLEKKFKFEVWMIGKGTNTLSSEELPDSIRIFGRLPFDQMFQHIEDADFILPLLDPLNQDHRHYLRGVSSGSRQLALGFSKVAIIHKVFATHYDFSKKDAILYEDGGLAYVMEQALTMNKDEYARLQAGLRELAKNVYDESLENLKMRIEERRLEYREV